METTEIEKKLYHFDQWEYAETMKKHEKMLPELNNLVDSYRNLEFKKPFDKRAIIQSMENTPQYLEGLKAELLIDFAKLPAVAQNVFRVEVCKKIRKFAEKVKEVKESAKAWKFHSRYRHPVDFSLFEVDKSGKIILSDASKKLLKEQSSMYIENETQQRIVSLMAEVNERFNVISGILKRNGITTTLWPETPERRGVFVIKDECNYNLKPEILMRIKNV
jgi:hypothetical protein